MNRHAIWILQVVSREINEQCMVICCLLLNETIESLSWRKFYQENINKNFFEVSSQTFVAPSYPILWLAETLFINNIYLLSDGWTKDDLVYVWRDDEPVQLAGNLSLPGGFQLGAYGSEYCDVVTATGEFRKLFSQTILSSKSSLMWNGRD